jgi:two-component system nitrate/nitrite response regulator NarP
MTKVLLADDDPLTMAGIKLLLSQSNYHVVAEASDGLSALELVPAKRPDLLVLDFDMPERNGLEVLRTLRERGDKRHVVLLTGRIADRRVYEALQLGLNGLVVKSTAPQNLLKCLDAVVQGRRWIDHELLQRAMDLSLEEGEDEGPLAALSPRERAVVGLVLRGMRNKDIASELRIGEGTVKVHLHNIFEKIGVASRTELVIAATKGESKGESAPA